MTTELRRELLRARGLRKAAQVDGSDAVFVRESGVPWTASMLRGAFLKARANCEDIAGDKNREGDVALRAPATGRREGYRSDVG